MNSHKNTNMLEPNNRRIFITMTTTVLLLALHGTISHTQTTPSPIRTPYIPPLTHTPGLGPSMIGTHSEPPFVLLESLPLNTSQRAKVDQLFTQHRHLLEQSVAHRLTMQSTVFRLVDELPNNTVEQAIDERAVHSQRIGELKVWQTVIDRQSAP